MKATHRSLVAALAQALLVLLVAVTLLGADAHAQQSAGGALGPSGPSAELLAEEDRIDLLPPGEQTAAYQSLKQKVQASGGLDSRVSADRINRKLSLASKRAAPGRSSYSERIALCREAVEIGEMHLTAGDPMRAIAWEAIADRIEPRNQWSRVLHNRVNDWFAKRLERALENDDGDSARSVISEWKALHPGDRAVDDGVRTYATHRWGELSNAIITEGPRHVLVAAGLEEERFPGLPAWSRLRTETAAALQRPFDAAISERDTRRAEAALSRQRALAEEFELTDELAPLADNRSRFEDLVLALQPSALERPYGAIRAPVLRLKIGADFGDAEFTQLTEDVTDSSSAIGIEVAFRKYGGDASTLWYGVAARYQTVDVTAGAKSASATEIDVNFLVGKRGGRSNYWLGVGAMESSNEFALPAIITSGSGIIYGNVHLGGEVALGNTLSLNANARYGQASGIVSWGADIGIRYYASPNLSVGARFATSQSKWDGDQVDEVKMNASGLGVVVMMQF